MRDVSMKISAKIVCVRACVLRTFAKRLIPVLTHVLHDQVAVHLVRVSVFVPATSVLVGPLHAQNRLPIPRSIGRLGRAHKELLVINTLLV